MQIACRCSAQIEGSGDAKAAPRHQPGAVQTQTIKYGRRLPLGVLGEGRREFGGGIRRRWRRDVLGCCRVKVRLVYQAGIQHRKEQVSPALAAAAGVVERIDSGLGRGHRQDSGFGQGQVCGGFAEIHLGRPRPGRRHRGRRRQR